MTDITVGASMSYAQAVKACVDALRAERSATGYVHPGVVHSYVTDLCMDAGIPRTQLPRDVQELWSDAKCRDGNGVDVPEGRWFRYDEILPILTHSAAELPQPA